MNGREFVRLAKRYARKHGLEFSFDLARGKGSHGLITVGRFRTFVQRGETARSTLASMLEDLNIDRREF